MNYFFEEQIDHGVFTYIEASFLLFRVVVQVETTQRAPWGFCNTL